MSQDNTKFQQITYSICVHATSLKSPIAVL